MNVFVAGASGAIGLPLVRELIRQGHAVTGMTRSKGGAKNLARIGAVVAHVSAFDAAGVDTALRRSKAEVVIDQLTALPKNPADMPDAASGDQKLRLEGGENLYRAARACGVRRYMQQSSGFYLRPGEGLADESEGLATGASPEVAADAQTYAELEARVLADGMEGVALRYGFYYGPGTWFHPETGRTLTRSGGRNSQSSAPAPASGRGSTSRTRPSRRSPRCPSRRGSITSSMTPPLA